MGAADRVTSNRAWGVQTLRSTRAVTQLIEHGEDANGVKGTTILARRVARDRRTRAHARRCGAVHFTPVPASRWRSHRRLGAELFRHHRIPATRRKDWRFGH